MPVNADEIAARERAGAFYRHLNAWKGFPRTMPSFVEEYPRNLSEDDVRLLERNGNRCVDWSNVLLLGVFELDFVRDCFFGGVIVLYGAGDTDWPAILEHSRFTNCAVGRGAMVMDVTRLIHVVVRENAEVTRCGCVGSEETHAFGLGAEIAFAPGSGRRRVPVSPEVRFGELAELARLPQDGPELAAYRRTVGTLANLVREPITFVGPRAKVANCGTIRRAYIGSNVELDGVPLMDESIILGDAARPTKLTATSTIRRLVAQEGCEVASGAQVDGVFMSEGSWVRDGACASSSVIGPDSGVGGGELRSSLIGPFVGFSHQALCIATFWPGGKGNISYGANVGSNHSGRAADQEHFAGEGVFYGLDCAIKFPFDSTGAPHSLVASGAVCLPQKINFPFSLINSPEIHAPEIPAGWNEILPGWQLAGNLYGLLRNEEKYAQRCRARREKIDTHVFREDLLPAMEDAVEAVARGIAGPRNKITYSAEEFLTEKEVPGLGKNYLLVRNAEKAIGWYRFGMRLILLLCDSVEMEHADRLATALQVLQLLRDNRRKDDARGARIIPDYAAIHGSAEEDPLIAAWVERVRLLQQG